MPDFPLVSVVVVNWNGQDVITGWFILMEDTIAVGDVVKVSRPRGGSAMQRRGRAPLRLSHVVVATHEGADRHW